LHVRDWPGRFENHRTRELRTLSWIPESTDLGGDTYAAILDHPDGPAHFGAAVGIHIAASKGIPRGYLRREDGRPHDAESLARLLRMPVPLVRDAIARLIELGDLEVEKKNSHKSRAVASRNRAETSRNDAERREIPAPEGKGTEGKGTEGKEENLDNFSVSQENAKPTKSENDSLQKTFSQNGKTASERLREALGERWPYLGVPTDGELNGILNKLGDLELDGFLDRLTTMAPYFVSERSKGRPITFAFFVRTAESYAHECESWSRIHGLSNSRKCRHGLPDGECVQCNPRTDDDVMSDSFSTVDDLKKRSA